ncbi:MAG: CPBP family intramembrane glutamic endopeptidase [Omnitrophica WOR_2 bacterium]
MAVTSISQVGRIKKAEIFVLFFVLEVMAFAILPLSANKGWMPTLLGIHTGFTVTFLIAFLIVQRSKSGNEYGQVLYVLFIAGLAVLLSTLFSGDLIRLFGSTPTNPQGIAMAKLSESVIRVATVLVLMAIAGADRRSLYLQKGKLGLGLRVGIPAFLVLAAIAFVPMVIQEGSLNKLLSLSPWILIFVLSNGFGEELLYRGLFLQRYETFLGKGLSNLLAAVVFTLVHAQVTYVSDVLQFLLVTFPLALIWGYLMQKTNSLWGSAIFHAGADCIIIFGIFAAY